MYKLWEIIALLAVACAATRAADQVLSSVDAADAVVLNVSLSDQCSYYGMYSRSVNARRTIKSHVCCSFVDC
jgi:hypothetical protein